MIYQDFVNMLMHTMEYANKFYLIADEGGIPENPEWYGVDFDYSSIFKFYKLKSEYKAEFFMNDVFIDNATIPKEFYYKFYASILDAIQKSENENGKGKRDSIPL